MRQGLAYLFVLVFGFACGVLLMLSGGPAVPAGHAPDSTQNSDTTGASRSSATREFSASVDFDHEGARTMSEADLAFGTVQLQKMLKSRPQMARFIEENDPLWEWTRRQFAGEHCPVRVHWLQDDSPGAESTCYYHPDEVPPAGIRVRPVWMSGPRRGEEKTFDELWAHAVYELLNVRGWKGFRENYDQALAGKIRNREEWIRLNAAVEMQAVHAQNRFYHKFWIPYSQMRSIGASSYLWRGDDRYDLDTYLEYSSHPDSANYHWYKYWGDYWDQYMQPYNAQMVQHRKNLQKVGSFVERWSKAIQSSTTRSASAPASRPNPNGNSASQKE